jgi:hypothetical protein
VFIGIGMDQIGIRQLLDDCLLTDAEMTAGESEWQRFQDPFPPWTKIEEE